MCYKKLFTHVESHASAVSLLESGEQCYIKAINNNISKESKHKLMLQKIVLKTIIIHARNRFLDKSWRHLRHVNCSELIGRLCE